MSFGELKHNIIATFGLFVIVLFCATILIFVGNTDSSIALIITTAILMFVLVPALASYVINASVYPGMYNLMTEKEKRSKKIDKKMDNRKKGQFIDEEDEENNIAEEFLDLDVEENKDGDEYIFYNGKMVKRSVIIKMKRKERKQRGNLMKAKHAEKRPKITISLWLFIAIIAFLVLLIIGITFYSVQRELNSDNKTITQRLLQQNRRRQQKPHRLLQKKQPSSRYRKLQRKALKRKKLLLSRPHRQL